MYKYARIFVYYSRNKREKGSFMFIKIVLKKNIIKININLRNILTAARIYDIIIVQKEKERTEKEDEK